MSEIKKKKEYMKNLIKKSLLAIMLSFISLNIQSAQTIRIEKSIQEKSDYLQKILMASSQDIGQKFLKAIIQQSNDGIDDTENSLLNQEQLQQLTQLFVSYIPPERGTPVTTVKEIMHIFRSQIPEKTTLREIGTTKLVEFGLKILEDFSNVNLLKFTKDCATEVATLTSEKIKELIQKKLSLMQIKLVSAQSKYGLKTFSSKIKTILQPAIPTEEIETDFTNFIMLFGLKAVKLFFQIELDHDEGMICNLEKTEIPWNKELGRIFLQSQLKTGPRFVKGKGYSIFGPTVSLPIDEYMSNPSTGDASILHEFGHFNNNSIDFGKKTYTMLALYGYEIMVASLPTPTKIGLLLSLFAITPMLDTIDEYRADSFMLQRATAKQLYYMLILFQKFYKEISAMTKPLSKAIGLPLEDADFLWHFLIDSHPTHASRMKRMNERIKEIESQDSLKAHVLKKAWEQITETNLINNKDWAQVAQVKKWNDLEKLAT